MSDATITLDRVELIAVSSTQLALTTRALEKSARQAQFASVKFITHDSDVPLAKGIERILIDRIDSSPAYSQFMLKRLADYVEAEFALIIQWDGYVLNGSAWTDDFLSYDYIGARWPHFTDEHIVGNGGFSLRSRRLLKACQIPQIASIEAEDVSICRTHRKILEQEYDVRFAPPHIADAFAFERAAPAVPTFGFHGFFNMVDIEGVPEFADLYAQADQEAIGDRELRDCLVHLLRKAPLRSRALSIRLMRDWFAARRAKRQAPLWARTCCK